MPRGKIVGVLFELGQTIRTEGGCIRYNALNKDFAGAREKTSKKKGHNKPTRDSARG